MPIRSLLSKLCSLRGSALPRRGFTLIELLVSIGVIGIVTSIVLVRYGSFDSATLLKNTAYDLALSVREAQIKSVSVVRGSADGFDYAYGISVNAGSSSYLAFRDTSSTTVASYDGGDDIINTYTFSGRTIRIADLCVGLVGESSEQCGLAKLDVMFLRPEYSAIVYAENIASGVDIDPANVLIARIVVASTQNPAERFHVKVTRLGQVSVCNEASPNCQ